MKRTVVDSAGPRFPVSMGGVATRATPSWTLAISIVAAFAACGSRNLTSADANATDLPLTPAKDAGSAVDGAAPATCAIVRDFGKCCSNWEARPWPGAATTDGCLVRWPRTEPPQRCREINCPTLCATALDPPSRNVMLDATRGDCRFVDECKRDTDCQLAVNYGSCCRCPNAFPSTLVGREACLQGPGFREPSSGCEIPVCDEQRCGGCPQSPVMSCISSEGLSRCVADLGG